MRKLTLTGLILIILSIVMMVFAVSMFSNSPIKTPVFGYIARVSFWLCLPTLFIGIAFLTWPAKRKKA